MAGVVIGQRATSWALLNEDERWRACVHETGHAVGAKLFGVPFGYVWLEPSPQSQFSHDSGAASICAIMAGGAAERLVFGDCLGVVTDRRNATPLMNALGIDDGGAALWGWRSPYWLRIWT